MLAWAKLKSTGKNYLGVIYTNYDGMQWFAELGKGKTVKCKKQCFCLWGNMHFTVTKVKRIHDKIRVR